MKIVSVKYARVFNLGNFENERIEIEAEINENETYEEVLAGLKAKVMPDETVAIEQDQAPLLGDGFPLNNFAGELLGIHQTEKSWLDDYDAGLSKTRDVRRFVNANRCVFDEIKRRAADNPNPRAKTYVDTIEKRVGGLISA